MLISFSLENWMSFHGETTFSMVAAEGGRHEERIPVLNKYKTRILPVAAIYGGNASGKTNFCEALGFAKYLVVEGSRPGALIPVRPFLLNSDAAEKPSRFRFELLVDKTIYEFSFAVTQKAVLEEKLVEITGTDERLIYKRRHGKKTKFGPPFDESGHLEYAAKGTRENQLFLTNSVSQKIRHFRPIHDWFSKTLNLISPHSRYAHFEQFFNEEHPLYLAMNEMLPLLDTGMFRLGSRKIPIDSIRMPDLVKDRINKDVRSGMFVLSESLDHERIVFSREGNELIAKKLVTYHLNSRGEEIEFEIRSESDGTKRMIDLLPAFLGAAGHASVFVIDEIDRSLHTLLIHGLVETYLNLCSKDKRSQMIFTTHDVLLMDQDLLRHDEMWMAERDGAGSSSLTSFSDFKDIRYDEDIRKSYLQGRLGGIPNVLLDGDLVRSSLKESNSVAEPIPSKKKARGSI